VTVSFSRRALFGDMNSTLCLFVFRNECILTIDPPTARDLDDAVSCKKLSNGNFLVGVHISDVSYFLDEGTPLDQAVARKATSTYLVDRVRIGSYELKLISTATILFYMS
jgi:hypothetical protein